MTNMIDRFRALGTAIVSDVLDEAGFHNQVLDPALGFVGSQGVMCGTAVCVRGERAVITKTQQMLGSVLPLYNLPMLASAGTVLVLSTTGFRGGAVIGELLATDLQRAGCAGIVTDGLVRDRDALAALDLPILAAGAIPANGARRFQIVQWGQPVHLPGPEGAMVTISPEDLILVDGDGALVIPAVYAERILEMAEELARKEVVLKEQAPSMTPEHRAEARANRMGHIQWLREPMDYGHEV